MPRLTPDEMYRAVAERDGSYEGLFVVGVKTTGIFCRPGCSARTPRRENVEFFAGTSEALHAGYRPCRRCRPLGPRDEAPAWVARVLELAERHQGRRLSGADLRGAGIDPVKAARYFKSHYGMTFQAYHRARRLERAAGSLRAGASATAAGVGSGYDSGSGFRGAFAEVFGAAPSKAKLDEATLLHATWIDTPLGPMLGIAGGRGLCLLEFMERRGLQAQLDTLRRRVPGVVVPGTNGHLERTERELRAYFGGIGTEFTVAIDAPGTEFQRAVWSALRSIPRGQTRSYAQVAAMLGKPSAVRAVARANGDNRIAIIIPCHRVIGSDGSLTGYAGGLRRKQWLLEHEGAIAGNTSVSAAARVR